MSVQIGTSGTGLVFAVTKNAGYGLLFVHRKRSPCKMGTLMNNSCSEMRENVKCKDSETIYQTQSIYVKRMCYLTILTSYPAAEI